MTSLGAHVGGCQPPTPPGPLLKKAGENQLDNFFGFPTDYAGGPLIGSGPLVLFIEKGRKNRRFVRKGGKDPSVPPGGRRGREAP